MAETKSQAPVVLSRLDSDDGKANFSRMIMEGTGGTRMNLKQLEGAVMQLNKASTTRKNARRIARNKDAIHSLMQSLNERPKFSKMVEFSVQCLKNLAVDEMCVEEMVEEGVLETLSKVLRLNPYNESVHRLVHETIACFVKSDTLASVISERLGHTDFHFSLKKHVEPETVGAACLAMSRLMRADKAVKTFVDNGAIDALQHVASVHSSEPGVMAVVADCLRNIVRVPANVQTVMGNAVLSQSVVSALKQFPYNCQLAESTCALVSVLASSSPDNAEKVKSLGTVEVVVAALEANPEREAVLKLGADSLKVLSSKADVSNALLVPVRVNNDTATAVVKLASMMLVDDNVQVMVDNKGIPWLVEAIKMAAAEPQETGVETSESALRILRSGCRALMRLSNDEKKIYQVMTAGAVGVLMSLVGSHGRDEQVLTSSLRALGKMVTRKVNADYLVKVGILSATTSALTAHEYSAPVVQAISPIIERLGRHPHLTSTLIENGCVKQLAQAIHAHIDKPEVVTDCLGSVASVGSTVEGAKSMLSAGILKSYAEVLSKHGSEQSVVKATLTSLDSLLQTITTADPESNPQEALALMKSEVKVCKLDESVLSTMEQYEDSVEVTTLGQRVMKLLAGQDRMKTAVESVANISTQVSAAPGTATMLAEELSGAVSMLNSLALVDTNVPTLVQLGATNVLNQAVSAVSATKSEAFPQKSAVLALLSEALERFALSSPEAALSIAQSSSLPTLAESAVSDSNNQQLAEHVMGLVAQCVKHSPQSLIQSGALRNVINVSQVHKGNTLVQSSATTALGSVMAHPELVQAVINEGGTGVVIGSLQSSLGRPQEALASLQVIERATTLPAPATAFAQQGGIDAVVNLIKKHSSDPQVVQASLKTLSAVLRHANNEEVALTMGQQGVIDLAIPSIRTHYKQAGVVESAVDLLEALTCVRSNRTAILKDDYAVTDLMKWVCTKFKAKQSMVETAVKLMKSLQTEVVLQEEEKAAAALKAKEEAAKRAVDMKINEMEVKYDEIGIDEILQQVDQASKAGGQQLTALLTRIGKTKVRPEDIKVIATKGLAKKLAEVVNATTGTASSGMGGGRGGSGPNDGVAGGSAGTYDIDDPSLVGASAGSLLALCEEFEGDVLENLEDPEIVRAHCSLVDHRPGKPGAILPPADMARALTSLAKLKMTEGVVSEILKAPDTLPSVIKLMTTSDDPVIKTQAAKLLGRISNNDEASAVLAKLSSIRELIDALRKNITNAEFLRYGIYLLGNVAITEELKEEIGVESGVQLLTQAINTHKGNQHVASNCLYTMSRLTLEHAGNCAFVVAFKGIPLVLSLLNDNVKDTDMADSAMWVLMNLCAADDSYKLKIVDFGGAHAVVDCILNNFDDEDIQRTALSTLRLLAYNAHAVDQIVKAGAVQGIVAGMTVMENNVDLLDQAVQVLGALITHANEEQLALIAQEGAVQGILDVSAKHSTNLVIEIEAARALCNLATQSATADLIIRQSGTEIVLQVLSAVGYDANFAELALQLLFNLTFSINNLNRLISSGVPRVVLDTLKAQGSSETVLVLGLRIIERLSYSDDVSLVICKTGALDFALQLITQSLSSPLVLCQGLLTISALTRAETSAVSVAETVLKLCSRILTLHVNDGTVMIATSRFLFNLFVVQAVSLLAPQTDIVSSLLQACLTHASNLEVVLVAIRPFENLAYGGQDIRNHMKEKQVIDVINKIIVTHPGRTDVKADCDRVIAAINRQDFQVNSLEFLELQRGTRNIDDVYAALGESKEEDLGDIETIPPKVRNFLTAGALLTKHSKTAAPRTKHVYVTDDFKWLVWKDPHAKGIEEDTKMKLFKIRSVEKGRCTEQLQRQRFGKYLADDKCAFAIIGRERTVDLEAPTPKDRDKWVQAIEVLIAYRRSIQSMQSKSQQFK